MAFSYNPSTLAGQLRLKIPDTAEFKPDGVTRAYVFDDAEIAAFLSMAGDNVFLAAADALRSIAGNQARIGQMLKVLDVELDTSKAAKDLLATAQAYEDRANNDGSFAIAEMVYENPFSYQERYRKNLQRNCY